MDVYRGFTGLAQALSGAAAMVASSGAVLRRQLLGLLGMLRAVRAVRALQSGSGRLLVSALTSLAEPVLRFLAAALLLRRLQHTLDMWAEYQERRRLFGKDPDCHDHVDCQVLYEPQPSDAIRADVVFIHGLNGSVRRTWMQGANWQEVAAARRRRGVEADDEQLSSCWPRDWLPQDCPGIRVVALGYTTDPYLWRPVWVPKPCREKTIQHRSKEMTEKLLEFGIGRRPIVWVAHSKGGLFVKQILVNANSNYQELVSNTHGILFYSVPHHGSRLAALCIPWLLGQSVEITEVRKDCAEIQELHKNFLSLYEHRLLQADVVSFVETLPTPLYFTYLRIVDEEAADPGVGQFYTVSANHRDICKPTNRKSILYQELTNLIHRVS